MTQLTRHDGTADLGTKPLLRLFLTLSLPIALGMMVNGLYNVVDAIFITRIVGVNAMGGIAIVFPIQMLVFAIAGLVGSGMASLVSRKLGAKDIEGTQEVLDMATRVALGVALVLTVLVVINLDALLHFMSVPAALMPYAREYLFILTVLGIPMTMLNQIPIDALRAEGKAVLMMVIMLTAAILNIILDALFIVVFQAGVAGAAYATVISQLVGLLLGLWFYASGKTELKLKPFFYVGNFQIVKSIAILGAPVLLSHGGVAFFIGLVNHCLASLPNIDNDLYISAYGIVGRVVIFAILPVIAMMVAFQTLSGYNYGAKLYMRVRKCIKIGLTVSMVYGVLMSTIMIFAPKFVLGIFTEEILLLEMSGHISLWIFLGFSLGNAQIMGSAFFQALGKGGEALFLSSCKVYFLLVPALIFLPRLYGIEGLWWSFPLADGVGFFVVMWFLFRARRKLLSQSVHQDMPLSNT